MSKRMKIDKEVLKEFLNEVDSKNSNKSEEETNSNNNNNNRNTAGLSKPYQCPSCHKSLSSRKEPCKYCRYKGYIPMGDDEIKRTRVILFIVLFVVAIAVYILTR